MKMEYWMDGVLEKNRTWINRISDDREEYNLQ